MWICVHVSVCFRTLKYNCMSEWKFVVASQRFPFSQFYFFSSSSSSSSCVGWKQVIWLDFEPIRHHHIRFLLRCLHDCSYFFFSKQALCTFSRFNTRTEDKNRVKLWRISLASSDIRKSFNSIHIWMWANVKRHIRNDGVRSVPSV